MTTESKCSRCGAPHFVTETGRLLCSQDCDRAYARIVTINRILGETPMPRTPRPSSACHERDWCVLQEGHIGPCRSEFFAGIK